MTTGVQISISLDDRLVAAMLRDMLARLDNPRPALKTIGEIVRTSIQKNFKAGGRPRRWYKSRRARAEGGQTLVDTARLMRSFTVNADKRSVAVGTNVVYAAVQNFGAARGSFGRKSVGVKAHTRTVDGKQISVTAHSRQQVLPWGTIPARPFMKIHDEDLEEMLEAVFQFVTRQNPKRG